MDKNEQLWRTAIALFLTLVLPFLLVSAAITLAEQDWLSFAAPWYVLLGVFLLPGLVGIELAPLQRWTKATLTAIYVPLLAFSFFLYSMAYACTFHGGCP